MDLKNMLLITVLGVFFHLIAHKPEIFPIRLDFSHDQTAIDPIIFCLNIKGLKNDENHSGWRGHIGHGGSYGIKSSNLQYKKL